MKFGVIAFSLACLVLSSCIKKDLEDDFKRGMEMLYNGNYDDAESHFLLLASKLKKNGRSEERIWRAKSLYEAGKIEHLYLDQPRRAVARLREAVKIYPEAAFSLKAQKEIAFIFYDRLRDYRTAALEFERLVNAFPDEEGIWKFQYRIAQSYFMIREFDQARAEARLLLEKHGKGRIAAEAMLLVANSYYIQGRYREAAEAHKKLLQLRPSYQIKARSLFEMGMCYQELGDYAQAEKSYLAALKKHPRPDLVKIQLKSLQKQMLEEEGDKDKTPYPFGAQKATKHAKPANGSSGSNNAGRSAPKKSPQTAGGEKRRGGAGANSQAKPKPKAKPTAKSKEAPQEKPATKPKEKAAEKPAVDKKTEPKSAPKPKKEAGAAEKGDQPAGKAQKKQIQAPKSNKPHDAPASKPAG